MPQISVLLPVYNAEPFVEAAVRSVLDQTCRDFELLVIDDGSSDGSLEVLRRLEREDSRISLLSRPNAGLVATLNELVAAARGTYLARMDADDLCLPHRFERQLAYLSRNPDCVALGSRCLFIDPDAMPICEFMDEATHDEIERALLAPRLGIVHPSVMLRRDAMLRIGGYRSGFPHVEDLDLFLRLGEIGRLANLQTVLLKYRLHEASVSHTHTVLQSAAGVEVVRAARARRGLAMPREGELRQTHGESRAQLHRKWSWWALQAGNVRTARKHARLALKSEPSLQPNLRLLACVLRDTVRHLR